MRRVAVLIHSAGRTAGHDTRRIVFMTTNISLFKRAFTFAVVAMTILWTMGAGLAPLMASAQVSLSEGDLVKGESFSTVYYYDGDGRYTFPSENIFFSWYMDFDDVVTISDSQLAGIALEGNVMARPGSRWIKITSNDKVYAVAPDGMLHWIESEAVAMDLYGSSQWNTNIDDIADVFFADYSEGASLMTADNLYNGALVDYGNTTYVIWDGMRREVSSAGFAANNFNPDFVMDTDVNVEAIPAGSDLNGYSAEISDVSQQAEGDGETSVPAGDISVSVASSTPAGATLPGGATGVEMTTWKFMGEGTVNSLVVNLNGINASTDISNVYIYQGSERLTESRSVNASTRQATFSNLGVEVADGSPVYLTLVAEIATSPTGGETVSFGIANADAVGSDADVSGSFPANGNTFTLVSDNAGTVTVTKNGTITDPAIGQQDAEIARFKVEADTEDAMIESVRLEIDNAAEHSDYKLWDGSELVATGVYASGDSVDFMFGSSFDIEEGDNNIFTLTADIGGETGDNIKVYIDKDTDLVAIGGDFGFGMQVDRGDNSGSGSYDGTSCTTSAGNCSFSTVDGGDVTLTFNGPGSDSIAIDSQDRVLMNFTLSTTQDITVKDLDLILGSNDDGDANGIEFESETTDSDGDNTGLIRGAGTEANFKDVSIRYASSGARLLGPVELSTTDGANDAYQLLDFSDDFFLSAGTSVDLMVTVDVDNNDPGSNTVAAAINMGNISIEDENGDALTVGSEIVPSGDINGNEFTTESPSLAFALASSPTAYTTVQGAENVNALGLTVEAGEAEDILVTDITIEAFGDVDDDGSAPLDSDYVLGGETSGSDIAQVEDFFSACSLYSGGELLDGPVGATTNGQYFVFDGMSWVVESGAVEGLNLYCDLANPSQNNDRYFAFNLTDASEDVTAETATDGTSVTATGDEPNGNLDGAAAPTMAVTISPSGSMDLVLDSSSPDSTLLMAGTADNWVSSFRFEAVNEDFMIETISFYETQAEDDGASSTSAYANNIGEVTIAYMDEAGQTQTDTAFMSGRVVKFSNTEIFVGTESDAVVDVYIDVPTHERTTGGSADSAERVEISFYDGDNSGTENFKAVGQGSGSTLGENATNIDDVDGNLHPIVETFPTVAKASTSPSGSSVPGEQELLRFSISAAGNEDVIFAEMVFDLTTTDNASSNWDYCDDNETVAANGILDSEWSIYNTDDMSNELEGSDADWNMLDTAGNTCATTAEQSGFVHLTLTTPERISAGTTETYAVWLDTTGASASADDAIRIDIPDDPIVSTFLDVTQDLGAAVSSGTSTTFTADASVAALVSAGDIICLDDGNDTVCDSSEETVLVQGVSTATIYATRGYLGRDADSAVDNGDELLRLPSSFVWYDDGDTTPTAGASEDAVKGSYLVDNLPIVGGTLVF